jgi:hypothetical protein
MSFKKDGKKEKKTTPKNRQSKGKNRAAQHTKNPKNERVIFAFSLPSS